MIKHSIDDRELAQAIELLVLMQQAASDICEMTFEDSDDFESLEHVQGEQTDRREQLELLLKNRPDIVRNDHFQKELSICLKLEQSVQSKIGQERTAIQGKIASIHNSKRARKTYDNHYDAGYGYFVDKQK